MDTQRFLQACQTAAAAERAAGGIGTLGERTLHMVLKRYFEPDEGRHEVKVGRFVADIVRPDGIVEIQTRDLGRLRDKLGAFLRMGRVTVVYPVAAVKRLRWIDVQTGEVGPARKSPKRGALWEVLPELYKIKPFLLHPNFRLCVVLLDLDELRCPNGRGADGKRGAHRCDRVPNALLGELIFQTPEDYRRMLPDTLPSPFRAGDFQAASKLNRYQAGLAVNALCAVGAIQVVGKERNAFIYV